MWDLCGWEENEMYDLSERMSDYVQLIGSFDFCFFFANKWNMFERNGYQNFVMASFFSIFCGTELKTIQETMKDFSSSLNSFFS